MPKVSILKTHDNYFIQKTYDKRSDSYYLESWGYFSDNKTIFLMSTPLASIRESVELANRFLAYVGIAALLVGSLFIYFATKKITSPILQLANLSEKMSNLDFDAKYTGQAEDCLLYTSGSQVFILGGPFGLSGVGGHGEFLGLYAGGRLCLYERMDGCDPERLQSPQHHCLGHVK